MTVTATERPPTAIDPYLEASARLSGERSESARLGSLRRTAAERFAAVGFPTVREEEWRFTNVAPIAQTEFDLDPASVAPSTADLFAYAYEGAARLVFVNGRMVESLSDLEGLPEGVWIGSLAAALETRPEIVEAHLGRHADIEAHSFAALNTALWRDGALVHVPRGVVVERPINIVHLGSEGDLPAASFPRHLIVAEENSQCTVLEQYATLGDGATTLVVPVVEVVAGPAAVVDHYKLQRESTEAFHVSALQVYLGRSAAFSSNSISWGGGIVRNDVGAMIDGEGADATLNGLYMVEGTQLVDNHMRVEHKVPNTTSHELFKGILEGNARSVFTGRIYVHEDAQKTDAKQSNRNLLLSDSAIANSNPQLEIFADDVRCTHGSTIGQLDDLAVFYLRSRGIGEVAARSLLTYAFASDIVQRIKVPAVRRDLEEFLFRRLPRGEVVRQAV